jgi:hypothetical protein
MWLHLYSGIAGLAYLPATQPHLRAASFTPLNRAALFYPRLVSLCGERGQGVRLVALAIFNLRGRAFPGRPKERIGRTRIQLSASSSGNHFVRLTDFVAAFTNLRTVERCEDENALLAAILADATNLGLGRMAAASHGVTRDKLIWTADAYIRPETYRAALARIIDAHHALPIAAIWGDGSTSSSDRQFFRSGKRGDAAGEISLLTACPAGGQRREGGYRAIAAVRFEP